MSRDDRRWCPSWCVADHAAEDDAWSPVRHRTETVVVPGISIRPDTNRTVESIEILIEIHAEDGDPVVGVYIGDGTTRGLDVTAETAERLVRRLADALLLLGAAQTSVAPKSRPSA